MTKTEHPDVIIVGSGPTGSAYARTLRTLIPDLTILMLEAGPALGGRLGQHVEAIPPGAQRQAAAIASQGPATAPYDPASRAEWSRRIAGGDDASLLRRPGLFVANHADLHSGDAAFAGFAAANVGGMGAHWSGGCPRPARSEYPDLFNDAEMDALLTEAEAMLSVTPDLFAGDPGLDAMIAILRPAFAEGRPADRRVRTMPMAAGRVDGELCTHGVDVILGDLLENDPAFTLRPNATVLRILHENGSATGVEVHDRLADSIARIPCRAVVVAADSLHGPQLLHASGIRPPALGRNLNEHFQVSLLAELDTAATPKGMMWIPCLGDAFPFSVTIGGANPGHMPFDRPQDHALAFISVFCAGDITPDNRLRFDDEARDWRGLPRLSVDLRLTGNDQSTLAAARALTLSIADAVGRPLPGHMPISPPLGSSLHYQGTLRMGLRPDDSVSDRNSRVWGFSNLHVAGNGVLPTATATNPTLMSVSLAIAGARALATRLSEGGLDA
ncbi:Choline dehydrogenase [Devosia enhydra]|uniref:Choline dehydrogenase n=1 Tax=Devosia enhydra TaxID=665118 RepID=A0A1K2I2F0_9HYPH|nr:GMC oxidoreductase [Devosia enhydra]SFZ85932.1 Choline dehydrogenase [Devosia enhydra]